MTTPVLPASRDLVRSIGVRQVRLGCGLVMFAYVTSHFLNHALGNISLDALNAGVVIHAWFWQLPPVAFVFYASVTIHGALGLWALYDRRQFHWKTIEPLQLAMGLSIPALIVAHVVAVRLGENLFDINRSYPQVLYSWIGLPLKMALMYVVLVVAWAHGCIGLYFWLRLKSFFARTAPLLLAIAVMIPTLALLGIYQGERAVVKESASPQWQADNLSPDRMGTEAQQTTLGNIEDVLLAGYAGLVALALLARGGRELLARRGDMITLSYGDSRAVRVPKGLSVLEASVLHNIPHASVCGGRARCSTCRIRILSDCASLPEPSNREAFVLDRAGEADPAIRLACQLRPTSDLTFVQLVLPHAASANAHAATPARIGQERYLVSMFVDMRGSTKLAEKRLPFDTVFIVNRFLAAVSQAVVTSGGKPNQFVGDGELALFGLDCDPSIACRQALEAAGMIGANVDELNQLLAHDLREPIRFGIGIHAGEVIVGDIGYRDHMVFTALGDAVNVAARLQDMTKSFGAEVIVSDTVCETAGIALELLPMHEVSIRGRDEPMRIRTVADARSLASMANARSIAATD